jgi:hypothetical protein
MTTPGAPCAALERRQAQRLAAQLLAGPPAGGTAEVAGRLLAVQAQDPRGARLAVRARSRARSAADVDAALTQDRSVVVTWPAGSPRKVSRLPTPSAGPLSSSGR